MNQVKTKDKSNFLQRKALAVWMGYVWITTLAGLAIHPYKSVRGMVFDKEKRVLLPVMLTPSLSLIAFFVVGRVGSRVMDLSGLAREAMALMLGWVLIGLILWQILMIVLLIRFVRGLVRE